MHPLDDKSCVYNVAHIARGFIANLRDSPLVSSADSVFLDQVSSLVESLLDRNDVGFCPNNLWYGNFLAPKGVAFIDLEMAGRGDIHFNLISFVHCHHLENEQARIFLDAYAEVSGFYPSTKKLMRMRVARAIGLLGRILRQLIYSRSSRFLFMRFLPIEGQYAG